MKLVYIDDILLNDSPHVRAEVNEDTVDEYAEAMRCKDRFPPVVLFQSAQIFLVGDGLHRIAAHRKLKRKVVEADVRKGGYEEALLFALAANNKHGVRRSPQDKRAGVCEALKHWPERTDNYLAEVCFVSNHLVKDVRDSLTQDEEIPEAPVRTASDGRKVTAPKPPPTPRPKKEEVHLDDTGWKIPTALLPMWERNAEVQAILTELSRFKGILKKAQEANDPLWGEVLFSNAQSDLQKVYENVALAKGYAVCHVCAGRPDIQPKKCCPTCKSKGLLSRFRWNTVVPLEIKKIRQQTKQKGQ